MHSESVKYLVGEEKERRARAYKRDLDAPISHDRDMRNWTLRLAEKLVCVDRRLKKHR